MRSSWLPSIHTLRQVSLTNEQSGYDAAIYVVTDCADIDNTCVAHGDDPETQTFPTVPNTTYYIIVDGYSSSSDDSGTFDFELSRIP